MGKTKRKDYSGKEYRDGGHGKHCPSQDCAYCVNGKSKKPARKKSRRDGKKIAE